MPPETPVHTAILLAAGAGSRLAAAADAHPKCLLRVAGTSILDRLLHALVSAGIERLVVVTGYRGDLVRQALAGWRRDFDIDIVVNASFAHTQNILSLWLARERVEEPCLLLESDLLFDPPLLSALMVPDRIAVSALDDWMRGTRVVAGPRNRIAGFRFPPFEPAAGQLKTVNIYSFSRRSWRQLADRLDRYVADGRVDVFYERALADLVHEGAVELEMALFPRGRWYEVDTPQDLENAHRLFSPRQS